MPQPIVSSGGQQFYDAVSQWHPDDELHGWPGLYWCEALASSGLSQVLDVISDKPDGTPGWSSLLDVDTCPYDSLGWLGQFRGVTIPNGITDAAARSLILNEAATGRGRPGTLVAAVQGTLTGSKYCVIHERDTSPYHATIDVFVSQMPDSAATAAVIAANKPAMLIIGLNAMTGPTYGQIRTTLPVDSYGSRETTYPTYGNVQEYIP